MRRSGWRNRVWIPLFAGFLAVGALFALFSVNGMETYLTEKAGILSEFSLRQLYYQTYESGRLFFYLFGKRMKWAMLLLVLAGFHRTAWGVALFGGWTGFSILYLGGIAVLKFGFSGAVMTFLLWFPQGIFYLWGSFLLFERLMSWEAEGGYWDLFPLKKLIWGFGILLLGILTESYVNQFCLKLIYEML